MTLADLPPTTGGPGRYGLTPSQTVGPFLSIGLTWDDGADAVPAGTLGAITLGGRLVDGAGEPVPDGLIETWQADCAGGRGFGRCLTDPDGGWRITTVPPGPVPAADGTLQAPHLDVSVFARGLLDRVVTRIYLPGDDAALAADPVLSAVPADRRDTLLARDEGQGRYRFDIHLQGERETVFFDL
jgi:protocatechuate 3,4-dioxygenase alpha subunit